MIFLDFIFTYFVQKSRSARPRPENLSLTIFPSRLTDIATIFLLLLKLFLIKILPFQSTSLHRYSRITWFLVFSQSFTNFYPNANLPSNLPHNFTNWSYFFPLDFCILSENVQQFKHWLLINWKNKDFKVFPEEYGREATKKRISDSLFILTCVHTQLLERASESTSA